MSFKQVLLSEEVINYVKQYGQAGDSHDKVLRMLLGLPERTRKNAKDPVQTLRKRENTGRVLRQQEQGQWKRQSLYDVSG